MRALTMLKKSENNGTEEIGLVTPTPGIGGRSLIPDKPSAVFTLQAIWIIR